MEKRSKLALVLLFGLLLLAFGLYLIFWPILKQRQANQPPPQETSNVPYVAPPQQKFPEGSTSTPVAPEVVSHDAKLRQLEYRAKATVERIGSGSSGSGFLGYQDVLLDATPNAQLTLKNDQKTLQTAHPANGSMFGLSTRVVSSHVSQGAIDDPQIVVEVDALQREDAGDPSKPTSTKAKHVQLTFLRQADGGYLIDSLMWSDVAL